MWFLCSRPCPHTRTRLYYGRASSVRDSASPKRFSPRESPPAWTCDRTGAVLDIPLTGNKPTLHAAPDDPFHPHSLRLHNSAVNNESSRTMHGDALSLRATMPPGSNRRRPIQMHLGGGLRLFCMISVDSKSSAVRVFILDFVFFFEIQRFVSIAKRLW